MSVAAVPAASIPSQASPRERSRQRAIRRFRWSILGTAKLYTPGVVAGVVISLFLLVSGTIYFKNTERVFADLM